MSKQIQFKTVINDLEVFKEIITKLGYNLTEKGLIKGYNGEVPVDYSIQGVESNKGYGIGLIKEGEFYKMQMDPWDNLLHQKANDILFEYKKAMVRKIMDENMLFEAGRVESKDSIEIYIDV